MKLKFYSNQHLLQLLIINLLSGLLLSGCIDDEEPGKGEDSKEPVSLNIRIRSSYGDSNQLGPQESNIVCARIFVFDGEKLDQMYFKKASSQDAMEIHMKIMQAEKKTAYAIINEPQNEECKRSMESVKHPSDLMSIKYNMSDYFSPYPVVYSQIRSFIQLPMFGQKDFRAKPSVDGGEVTVDIPVERSMARVDILMRTPSENMSCLLKSFYSFRLIDICADGGFISGMLLSNGTKSHINLRALDDWEDERSFEQDFSRYASVYVPAMWGGLGTSALIWHWLIIVLGRRIF